MSVAYSAAVISECGLYRYELIRRWASGPLLEWVMLNPSTADATTDDPTIRRCIGFAKSWGYGGIVVHNLYAYRAAMPSELACVEDPIGPANRDYLGNRIGAATVFAWGAHPAAAAWLNGVARPYDIRPALKRPEPLCLGETASGMPRHPLYVPAATAARPWERS